MTARTRTAAALACCALLTGCAAAQAQPAASGGTTPSSSSSPSIAVARTPAPSAAPSTTLAVALRSNVRHGSTVPASSPLSISASAGTLRAVTVTGGPFPVEGALAGGTWTATTALSPGAQYKVRATVLAGTQETQRSFDFTTAPSAKRLGIDVSPNDGMTVGVAHPVALRFNVPVESKQEVIDALAITTVPATEGAWRWISDVELRWRPAQYWHPGTRVRLDADLRGIDLGGGVYARSAFTQAFEVGRKQVLRINARSKQMKVFRDGKLVRVVPVSLGKPGFETRSGVKVALERYRVKRMRSTQPGESYDLQVPYAIRLTWSGEFLHGAPWASGRLGRANGSHGCTNVSLEDGRWLFKAVQAGDPVVTVGTKRGMELGNGYGDWNVSWQTWKSSNGAD